VHWSGFTAIQDTVAVCASPSPAFDGWRLRNRVAQIHPNMTMVEPIQAKPLHGCVAQLHQVT
jgi:hypothetical protein